MVSVAFELLALFLVVGLTGCAIGCFARRFATDASLWRWRKREARLENVSGPLTAERLHEPSNFVPEPPDFLSQPKNDKSDDLKKIKGIGGRIEKTLNEMGLYHFSQIANWSRSNVHWVDLHLKFKGRVDREAWVPQARKLVAEQMRTVVVGPSSGKTGATQSGRSETSEAVDPDAKFDPQIETLSEPRAGGADDLRKISGVGPKLERKLNDIGIYHYEQIACWTEAQVAHVDGQLKFKGRIKRERWCDQAKKLSREASRSAQEAGDAGNGDGAEEDDAQKPK